MAKEAGTGMPGSVGVPPPSFCLPNERAALLRYCSQEENRNAHWIARGWTLKGFPEFPQGADVGIRAFTVTDAPSQVVPLTDTVWGRQDAAPKQRRVRIPAVFLAFTPMR